MASPGLIFADSIQDQRRLGFGIAFGSVLEEVLPCLRFLKLPAGGETIELSRVLPDNFIEGLSSFKAVGASPQAGTPDTTAVGFRFRRLNSLAGDDISLAVANAQPNDLRVQDQRLRQVSIKRLLATALMQGQGDDATGPLGWEFMTAGVSRTDVASVGATSLQTLQTLSLIDDTCTSKRLGDRGSAYVTTQVGRRNIEAAARNLGVIIQSKRLPSLPNPVPHYRGKPILVSSGLIDDEDNKLAPTYAVDLDYVFMLATTGDPEGYCIESRELPLQADGTVGVLQWFHGACIVRHPVALVRSTVTTLLSN